MKIPATTVSSWIACADEYFRTSAMNRFSIETGAVAWILAGKLGFLNEAYSDRSMTDAHIVTALKKVFPDAQFTDAYHY